LLKNTHPKFFNKKCIIFKKIKKCKNLQNQKIITKIIQIQFLILLNPFYENYLPPTFYGYREGRTPLQALAHLSREIQTIKNINTYLLIQTSIKNYFKNLKSSIIFKIFYFPNKYLHLFLY
jgi:hypothetical protein